MDEKIDQKSKLEVTASCFAAVDASESKNENLLIFDPVAEMISLNEGLYRIKNSANDSFLPIILRTKYFVDFIHQAFKKNNYQIVLIFRCNSKPIAIVVSSICSLAI